MSAWQDIIGHEWAVELLRAAAGGQPGHAYLLTGPASLGKATIARTFAQALNCTTAGSQRPCGHCRACTLIASDRHPDVIVVEAEPGGRGTGSLKIDQIRRLQQDLNLSPTEARYKVALIANFESATASAANALLKSLEEPPGKVVLLLTAGEAEALLPTIVSRCLTLALRPLAAGQIQRVLEARWRLEAAEARLLAHLSNGRPGWAIRAMRDESVLESRRRRLAELGEALGGTMIQRFQLAERLAQDSGELIQILRQWLSCWHDLALLALAPDGMPIGVTNLDKAKWLDSLARQWSRLEPVSALRNTELAIRLLDRNANARLVMENLLLAYPTAGGRADIGER